MTRTPPLATNGMPTAPSPAVLHCVYREALASVFASQVLKPVRALRDAGVAAELMMMAPLGEWVRGGPRQAWRRRLIAIRDAVGDRFVRLPSPPARLRNAWDDSRTLARWLRTRQYDVLHCRGSAMTNIALKAVRQLGATTPVIFDCRGVDHAEHVYAHGIRDDETPTGALRHEWQQRREAIATAAGGADAIICVSQAMADYLRREFGVDRGKILICPCAVDTNAFADAQPGGQTIRESLNLQNRFVVVYCGSTRAWQLPDHSVRLFKRIRQHDPSAFFLVLTPQEQVMRERLDEAGVAADDCHVVSVPHDQVPRYLGAGDLALLLREPCLVNGVASPVKFAEYLAAGLPVLLTEGIGDYSSLAESQQVGCVWPYAALDSDGPASLDDFLPSVRREREAWRQRCQQTAQQQLSLEINRDRAIALYHALQQSGAEGAITGRHDHMEPSA